MAKYEVTRTIDVRGEVCPVPDVEAKRAVKKGKDGDIIMIQPGNRSTGKDWRSWV